MKRLVVMLAMLALAPAAWAGDLPSAAKEVQADLALAKTESAAALDKIRQRSESLQARLRRLQEELASEKQALAKDRQTLQGLHKIKSEAAKTLAAKSVELGALEGHVRAAASDFLALARRSPVTAEDPQRLARLESYLDKNTYPGLNQIQDLIGMLLAEIKATGQVAARDGSLINRDGQEVRARIVRLGGFCTIYQSPGELGFAAVGPGTGRLLALPAEPSWGRAGTLEDFIHGQSGEVVMDISQGAALGRLARRVGLWEHIKSGGPLVWPILLVGLAALILIAERLIFLQQVRSNTDMLMVKVNRLVAAGDLDAARSEAQAMAGRPTSNVILAGLELKGQPSEVIEGGLSEAMLRELPRLERFLTALKVLAAVAPLLGLLGTVTGMINTFHVITAFGAGDPRLMAGGISEALVTTQLGLAVAIPIMLAAALLGRQAQRITGDMEEKAVALSAALSREAA